MRIGLRLPACDRADRVAAAAAYAEAAGFDSVWVPDSQLLWRDTFVALALAAASTKRIALASGVTNLVTRHVTVVASGGPCVRPRGCTATALTPLPGPTPWPAVTR